MTTQTDDFLNLFEQIAEAWRIHNRTMLLLIDQFPDEAFSATLSKRGGRDVACQLAHIHNVRVPRLESISKKINSPIQSFPNDLSPSREKLKEAFLHSSVVMEAHIQNALNNDGQVSNFKRGVVPMIGYFISHEAHHRGNILLTIKECGIKIPDSLKWTIWEWNKI